ncbi:MAG: signal peptidase II [Eubacteriales bacterium]|nr:signal peptidase II [Eubacteriales bacterium]
MKTSKKQSKIFFGLISCLLFISFDQLTKWFAVQFLKDSSDIVLIPQILELHYLENVGVAFGALKNRQWIPILFALIITILFSVFYCRIPSKKRFLPLRISIIGIIAGAVGNLIDRIWHGYVVDFIYVVFIDFPVFNIADCYIVVSIISMAILMLFVYREEELKHIFDR